MSNKFIETIKAAVLAGAAISSPAHADNQLNLANSFVEQNKSNTEIINPTEEAEKRGCESSLKPDAECFEAKAGHINAELLATHLSLNGISLDTSGYVDLHQESESTAIGMKTRISF